METEAAMPPFFLAHPMLPKIWKFAFFGERHSDWRCKMKVLAAACILVFGIPGLARAKDLSRIVSSGQTAEMANYRSWNNNCVSGTGVVTVLAKPQHGKLSTRIIDTIIGNPRIKRRVDCTGLPTKGFQVSYTSERDFHGTDNFSLDITWPTHRDVDHFTVTVR